MDIRKLEIFEAVARLKNFSRAAEELHMAQPAVSIAVKKLEDSLENILLERDGREVKLTAEGEATLRLGREVLMQMKNLKQHIQGMGELSSGELTLACPSMFAKYYLGDVLQNFLLKFPGVSASIVQLGTQKIEQMILDDEVELGVIIMEGASAQLDVVPLVEQHLVACVGNSHAWAARKRLSVKEFDGEPMVLYQDDYFVRQAFDELCQQEEIAPLVRLETNSLPLINKLVRQGVGGSVALSMMSDKELGIHCIPITPKANFTMGVAKRKGRSLSRANRAFVEWLLGGNFT